MSNIMNSKAYAEARKKAEEKVKELNLTEKIGQLSQFGTSIYLTEENLFRDLYAEGKIGAYITIIGADKTNKIQKELIETSRSHIPALFGDDVIHGFHTTFPTPLAQSCSWNPKIVRRGCEVAAKEARRSGVQWTYSPMVDIARDPRWGRVIEGYGEDTYLCSRMSEAAVKGYQGEGETLGKDNVFACMKHFIGYGAAIGGRDYNSAEISDQHLHDVYLPPFAAGIEAGAATVMTAFEDINGVPATANKYILKDVLRDEVGFKGLVVSDAGATSELTHHGFAENEDDAAIKAFNAGCDMSMQLMGNYYNKGLPIGINEGRIDVKDIEESAIRVLTLKYLCGVMDDPYTEEGNTDCFFSDEHMKATYDAAIECAVLLENDGSLPIKNAKKIALIGALAGDEGKRHLLGAWAGHIVPEKTVTIEEGLRKALGESAEIVYSYGCSVADDGSENDDNTIAEAVKIANDCDTVICVVGEEAGRSGEASSYANIHLPGNQEKLIDELLATGKKLIVLVASGRPVILSSFNKKVNALMQVWQLGSMAGAAIADLVLGKVCPSGHLTLSHPRSEGQIPIYYNHYNTGRPLYKTDRWKTCYRDLESTPLYPFGYGLSYTSFEYSDIKLSDTVMNADGEIEVSLNVKNIGECDGAAVVQLYVRDLVGCRVRPVKELKGFKKVFLKRGEEKAVKLCLPASSLAFHDISMNKIVEPGKFKLWIAESSDDNRYEFDFEVK